MGSKRRNPVAHAGNYVQETDSLGMDESMKSTLYGTNMSKIESDYIKSRGSVPSSKEAVRRARKANKQPPVKEDE